MDDTNHLSTMDSTLVRQDDRQGERKLYLSGYIKRLIDEFTVYDKSLSLEEIQADYVNNTDLTPPELAVLSHVNGQILLSPKWK